VPISILPREFRDTKFIVGFDLEKAATGPAGGVSFSGISSRGGELLTIDTKGFGAVNADPLLATAPVMSFVSLNFDAIIEINQDGVTISE
jgi:hypothetical protein